MPKLHLELHNGAAGDMLLAALIDCGADYDYIVSTLKKLDITDWDINIATAMRSGIAAKNITITDKTIQPQAHTHDHHHKETHTQPHDHAHGHHHNHTHEQPHDHHHKDTHEHSHSHTHNHSQPHTHAHGERHLADMLKVLNSPALSETVKKKAAAAFDAIASAEGAIHYRPKDKIHFHEISGIDTLIDIIGSALAIENLGVDYITATPVATGSGTVACAHGIMPVPAPATLKIATEKNIPLCSGSVKTELLTPTGAAILGVYVDEFTEFTGGNIEAVGYGAGDKDFPNTTNTVRAVLYTELKKTAGNDTITEFIFTIDDSTGEEIGILQEKLYTAGVLESYTLPTVMKKSRPGFEVKVLLNSQDKEAISSIIFKSGLTIGMRVNEVTRYVLERKFIDVDIAGNSIPVKISSYQDKAVSIKAEADIVKEVAGKLHKEFREIKLQAESKAREII